jgi:predicted transcriptional regulator YheO
MQTLLFFDFVYLILTEKIILEQSRELIHLQRKLLKQVKELDDVIQKHPEIMFRLQAVEFALKHSVKLAAEAFGVSKSTIYRWIKEYKNSNNNPVSLKNRYVSKKE